MIMVVPLLLCSCSMRTFYPTLGGVTGGAVSAALSGGNPLVVAAGAGAGVLAGELAKGNEDLKQAKATITAISKGDVEALVAAGMGKQKGFVEEALDSIYGFIKLCLIGILLYTTLPIIYTRFVHKKTNANGTTKKTES